MNINKYSRVNVCISALHPRSMDEEFKKEAPKAFVGGIICTLILVIVVPILTTAYIQPVIETAAGSLGIAIISSSLIVTITMLLVTILFSLLLGGGAILRRYGVIGVLGLIFAYFIMNNPYGAIIPVATIILVAALKQIWVFYKNGWKRPKKKKKVKKRKS